MHSAAAPAARTRLSVACVTVVRVTGCDTFLEVLLPHHFSSHCSLKIESGVPGIERVTIKLTPRDRWMREAVNSGRMRRVK